MYTKYIHHCIPCHSIYNPLYIHNDSIVWVCLLSKEAPKDLRIYTPYIFPLMALCLIHICTYIYTFCIPTCIWATTRLCKNIYRYKATTSCWAGSLQYKIWPFLLFYYTTPEKSMEGDRLDCYINSLKWNVFSCNKPFSLYCARSRRTFLFWCSKLFGLLIASFISKSFFFPSFFR